MCVCVCVCVWLFLGGGGERSVFVCVVVVVGFSPVDPQVCVFLVDCQAVVSLVVP